MLDRQEELRTRARRRRRWLSLAAGVLIVGAGVVAMMKIGAAQADGSPQQQQAADSAAAADSGETAPAGAADSQVAAEGEENAEKAPVPVEVSTVESGAVSAYISSTANLVAEFDVKVLAEVEGRVLTLLVDEGDEVRAGQVLATLVQDDQQINLRKAELKESNARLAYDRARDLVEKELISREEFDKLTIEHRIAEQELQEAKWSLRKATISAPFAGRVTQRMIQVGQHVQVGEELFRVTDFETLIARIYLPERDVLGLQVGRPVRLRLNADQQVVFGGRIRQISPVVDTATGTVKVIVEASDGRGPVRPGSFVTVDIVRESRADALLLPRGAVLRELKKAHVFIAEDNVAVKRVVTLGLEEGEFVEALSGVASGERVIVAGQGGLKDGSLIKILPAADRSG